MRWEFLTISMLSASILLKQRQIDTNDVLEESAEGPVIIDAATGKITISTIPDSPQTRIQAPVLSHESSQGDNSGDVVSDTIVTSMINSPRRQSRQHRVFSRPQTTIQSGSTSTDGRLLFTVATVAPVSNEQEPFFVVSTNEGNRIPDSEIPKDIAVDSTQPVIAAPILLAEVSRYTIDPSSKDTFDSISAIDPTSTEIQDSLTTNASSIPDIMMPPISSSDSKNVNLFQLPPGLTASDMSNLPISINDELQSQTVTSDDTQLLDNNIVNMPMLAIPNTSKKARVETPSRIQSLVVLPTVLSIPKTTTRIKKKKTPPLSIAAPPMHSITWIDAANFPLVSSQSTGMDDLLGEPADKAEQTTTTAAPEVTNKIDMKPILAAVSVLDPRKVVSSGSVKGKRQSVKKEHKKNAKNKTKSTPTIKIS